MKKAQYVFIPAFLFLILFFILSYFNRFSHDDLGYLKSVQYDGIVQSTLLNYNNWNTRWASILLANSFFYCIENGKYVWIFHSITFTLLLISIHHLFSVFKKIFKIKIDFFSQLSFSMLFVLLLFYNTFSTGDVWFWLNASCMYLWNVSAAFFAFAFILSNEKIAVKSVLISIAGIYIGGSSEPFVLFILAFSTLFYFTLGKMSVGFSAPLLFLFVFCIIASFAISFFGNGNSIRSEALPDETFLTKNYIFLKEFIKFWIFYMPQKIAGTMLISFPFAFLGAKVSNKKNNTEIRNVFAVFFVGLIFFSALMLYFMAMIMSEAGPERAWTSFSVLFSISFTILFFELGRRNFFTENTIRKVFPLSLILTSSLLILITLNQGKVLKKYSQAYDSRMEILKKLKNKNISGTVYLPKLPSSGILRTAEINSTPEHFTNQQLKNYFDLPFNIAVKK